MSKDLVKELGLNGDYIPLTVNDKQYVLRRPTAMEEIELQDDNVEIEGNVDVYGYIMGILKFITPQININEVIIKNGDSIVIGDKTVYFKDIKVEDAFKIILSTSKVGLNSNGDRVMKINQSEAIRKIIANSDKDATTKKPMVEISDFKTKKELSSILEKFQSLFDVDGAMMIYTTFQDTLQD